MSNLTPIPSLLAHCPRHASEFNHSSKVNVHDSSYTSTETLTLSTQARAI